MARGEASSENPVKDEQERAGMPERAEAPSDAEVHAALERALEAVEHEGAAFDRADRELRELPLTPPEADKADKLEEEKERVVAEASQALAAAAEKAPEETAIDIEIAEPIAEDEMDAATRARFERDARESGSGNKEALAAMEAETGGEAAVAHATGLRRQAEAADRARIESTYEELNPIFDEEAARRGMARAKSAVEDARKALEKFEGFGRLRRFTAAGRAEEAELRDALEGAQKEYERARAELVGADAMRMLEQRISEVEETAAVEAQEKNFAAKAFEKAHGIYTRLGNANLDAAFGAKVQNRYVRAALRMASLRTVASAGLLGVSAYAGAGAAVGMAAIGMRRVLAGVGGAAGSYDLMRMAADRSIDSFRPSAEELGQMDDATIIEKMEKMEARAALGGRKLDADPIYDRLKQEIGMRLDAVLATAESEEEKQAMLELYASEREANVSAEMERRSSRETKMRLAGIGVGAIIGSGMLARMFGNATRWAIGGAEHADAAHGAGHAAAGGATEAAASHANEAPPSMSGGEVPHDAVPTAEAGPTSGVHDLTEIRKGDGYVRIFARQMEADPAKYGYDAAKDGSLHKWAMKAANRIASEQGLEGKGLKFDAKHPGHVTLNPDGTVRFENAHQYARVHHAAASEKPMPEEPVAQAPHSDTLSSVQTYVDPDGTPYYRHDWSQFKFTEGIPDSAREEVARSIDLRGKEIQDMVRLADAARAKYGHEAWFNRFDLMMQKAIRGSYVDWRHDMRLAAGVDKGTIWVNQAVPEGDPKKAAKMVFESVRLAGGFPMMDVGSHGVAKVLGKTIEATVGDHAAEAAAGAAKEAVGPVDTVRAAQSVAKFAHDSSGRLTGMTLDTHRGLQDLLVTDVKPDWREIVAAKAGKLWEQRQDAAWNELVDLDSRTEIYRAMLAHGQGATEEAKWLGRQIVQEQLDIETKYGNILK